MVVTDPIADMLTRIRNALTAKHETVEIPASNMKKAIAEILLNEGYISNVEIKEDGLVPHIDSEKEIPAENATVRAGLPALTGIEHGHPRRHLPVNHFFTLARHLQGELGETVQESGHRFLKQAHVHGHRQACDVCESLARRSRTGIQVCASEQVWCKVFRILVHLKSHLWNGLSGSLAI